MTSNANEKCVAFRICLCAGIAKILQEKESESYDDKKHLQGCNLTGNQ